MKITKTIYEKIIIKYPEGQRLEIRGMDDYSKLIISLNVGDYLYTSSKLLIVKKYKELSDNNLDYYFEVEYAKEN